MKKGCFLIIVSTILFSSMEISIKLSGSMFNPVQMNFLRFFIGGIILLPIAISRLRKENTWLMKRDIPFFALTGFLCIIISMTFFQLAISYTKASIVAILFSCNPVVLLILTAIFLKEKLSTSIVISILVSLLGVVFIINPFELSHPLGIVLALMSAISFAAYSVVCRYGTKKYFYDGIVLTVFTFIIGSLELLGLILISHIQSVSRFLISMNLSQFANIPVFKGINTGSLPMLLYLGIGVTGIGFCCYFLAMDEVGVSLSSLIFFIKPALAPIFALMILNEVIHLNTIIGIVIILIGSVITFMANLKTSKNNEINVIMEEER
ncbi:DMT family transporter [Eubacterium multiforme]|uniref:Drug/metabolite transporter (DMT)-like permease n=1 Tax=Eubacterium multiforme TaxID=83339 RepID=A0ABT9UT23_9FIRM|nr:DMT family transporter [Eubacterium multiforme]MDQ0149445.1 drug/metabolite transporter (DMT)-like permease [Eubacterium multiforme]